MISNAKIPISIKRVSLFLLISLSQLSCAGRQYISTRQGEGLSYLHATKPDEAIEAFKRAVKDAEKGENGREISHLKGLLGWAYAEGMQFNEAEKEIKEAVRIAEAKGIDLALLYARLAVVCSKSGNYNEGLDSAEKALTLTAKKWETMAGTKERGSVIDYAIKHHGYPPDVDMIRTVTMSEASLAVLYLLKESSQRAIEWGETAVSHFNELSFLMNLASGSDRKEFYRGMGVAAAATSRAYRDIGEGLKEKTFLKIGMNALPKAGIKAKDGDLLSAYAMSGGYSSLERLSEDVFRPDPKYSGEFNEAERLYFYGRYGDADRVYRAAIQNARDKGNKDEAARALSQLGWMFAESGRYPEAIRTMKEGIAVLPQDDFTAVTYARLVAIEGRLGNYEKGLDYADKALDTVFHGRRRMFQGKDRDSLIDQAMKNPGLPPDMTLIKSVTAAEAAKTTVYYLKGDYDQAIKTGNRAIAHFKDISTAVALAPMRERISYYEGLAFTTLTVGDSYLNIGDIKDGRGYLERSREYFKKARLNFGDVIAEGLIGYSHVMEGDYQKGAEIFKTNLARIETGGMEELKWHIRGKFARSVYNEARIVEASLGLIASITDPVKLKELKDEIIERNETKSEALISLLDTARAQRLAEAVKTLEKTDDKQVIVALIGSIIRILKEEAYKNYLGAIENIESIRSILETDLNKRVFQANKQLIYSDFIEISIDLYGPEEGFAALERAKARSLMDLLATKETALKNGGRLKEELKLRESIGELQVKAKREERKGQEGVDKWKELTAEIKKKTERYRDILMKIRRDEPELASLISASYLRYGDIKEILPDDVTLIEYFMMENKLYIWAINKTDIGVKKVNIGKWKLKERIKALRDAIAERDSKEEGGYATGLYKILIAPLKDRITGKRLGIVPHDVLHYLPFNALRSDSGYLIEEYPLFSAPSASVLKYALDKGGSKGDSVVAFGNPDLEDPIYDLPYAQLEVEGIAKIYPNAKTYLGKNATEGMAKSKISGYDIIHFAGHAEFSPVDPLYSSIRLARDQKNDGRLEVNEIFDMEMKPYLVTLSACKTGVGS